MENGSVGCSICGISGGIKKHGIPFTCRYCGLNFCYEHRLPIHHLCPFTENYKGKYKPEESNNRVSEVKERIGNTFQDTVLLRFSKIEFLHLLLGTGLVTAVGLSLYNYRITWEFLSIFISAFIVHELAHKFLAQYYSAWAEFRVHLYGFIVTAISALPIMPFKFIAPGAIYISGTLSRSRSGRISLIGPMTNIVMGFGFLGFHIILPDMPYLLSGATFNGWIALFNMLPFGGLDGEKIFAWNKIIWGITIAISSLLFIIRYSNLF